MWILPGSSTDEEGAGSIETVTGLVTGQGGEMVSAEPWGRRTLSYPIEKNTQGAYFLAKFRIDGAKAQEIDRAVEADQSIIRHLVVRQD